MAMKVAVEELIAIRYMLRCLGVRVEHASRLFGDNLGVIHSSIRRESALKKKHVAISYHRTREAAAASIVLRTLIDLSTDLSTTSDSAATPLLSDQVRMWVWTTDQVRMWVWTVDSKRSDKTRECEQYVHTVAAVVVVVVVVV